MKTSNKLQLMEDSEFIPDNNRNESQCPGAKRGLELKIQFNTLSLKAEMTAF